MRTGIENLTHLFTDSLTYQLSELFVGIVLVELHGFRPELCEQRVCLKMNMVQMLSWQSDSQIKLVWCSFIREGRRGSGIIRNV